MTSARPTSTRRPVAHPAADPAMPNVVSVISGKGGVGKTFIAVTLSHALAQRGKRVLLVDGDLGLANVDIQLGLMPECDLGDVVANGANLLKAKTHFAAGGFDIVAGRSGSGTLAGLDKPSLLALRRSILEATDSYDLALQDLGAGIDGVVRTLTANAGPKVVVTTPEPTALTDAYACIKILLSRRRDDDVRILVNKAGNAAEGEATYAKLSKACKEFLKTTPALIGIVERDPSVADAIRHQAPLLTRHPAAPASAQIERIAAKLASG